MIVVPQFGKAGDLLANYLKANSHSRVFVLVDHNTNEFCLPIIADALPENAEIINIKPGEHNKNIQTCVEIWEMLTEAKADRKSLFINLGGGVISDMGGFCAATFKRGIDFINFPTTLLAQVDAGVGGKLGIDFNLFKNHIGLFKEPKNIFTDTGFLKTLPERQLRSGFAEIIKHSLIKSNEQWKKLTNNTFPDYQWNEIITESVQVKSNIVKSDFRENGERKLLNFGHTIGHAIESILLADNVEIYHGEAVAAGMIMESYISNKFGNLNDETFLEILEFIDKIYERIVWDKNKNKSIFQLMQQDKKNNNETVLMTAIDSIGKGVWDFEITETMAMDALRYYNQN